LEAKMSRPQLELVGLVFLVENMDALGFQASGEKCCRGALALNGRFDSYP
jgi:hypothetical protein